MRHRTPVATLATHSVTNQPPPLADFDAYGSDPALRGAVAAAGGDIHDARLAEFGRRCGAAETRELARQANEHPPRLKDKLGDRSNASAEIEYHGAWAERIGAEGRGVATIIEMVRMTRYDCALGSAGGMRAALVRALWHTAHRRAFGKALIDQPAMRAVLADLVLESEAATALALRVGGALDRAADDAREAAFVRLATPAAKFWICKRQPGFVHEALECLGGAGYVEDGPMPRLFRQAPLNAIWKGSGNVIALDILRAVAREPEAAAAVLADLDRPAGMNPHYDAHVEGVRRHLDEHASPTGTTAPVDAAGGSPPPTARRQNDLRPARRQARQCLQATRHLRPTDRTHKRKLLANPATQRPAAVKRLMRQHRNNPRTRRLFPQGAADLRTCHDPSSLLRATAVVQPFFSWLGSARLPICKGFGGKMPRAHNPCGFRMAVVRKKRVVKAVLILGCCLMAAPSDSQSDTRPAFGSTANAPSQRWTLNQAIPAFTVPAAIGGDGTLRYSAIGLPAGVTMSAAREVSGTPTRAGSGTAVVIARDTDGDTDALTFSWTVQAPPPRPSYQFILPSGTSRSGAFTVYWGSSSGATSYELQERMDSGAWSVVYTGTTRHLRRSRETNGVYAYRVRACKGAACSDWTAIDSVTVSIPDRTPTYAGTIVAARTWVQGQIIPAFTVPAATGGNGTLTYRASGLPAGVTMSATREISGTPTTSGTGTATVTARDADGDTATLMFTWTVEADTTPSFGTTTIPDRNWVADKAITGFTVPAASGGNAPLMHAIRGLPAGVMMMESREITGTPTAAGSGTAIVGAKDADGDVATVSFDWTVTANAVPSYGTASVASQNWNAGQTITAFTVPSASGGNGTLIYGTSGLPEGVILSPSLQLSGQPTSTSSGTAVVTARDTDGDTATLRFGWTVASPNPANTGTVFSVDPNPTESNDYTVEVNYTGSRTYTYFTFTETGPWGHTRTHYYDGNGALDHNVTNRVNGVYTYSLTGCSVKRLAPPDSRRPTICERAGDDLEVTVNGPDSASVATQMDYAYQARKGDINGDGRMDLFIDRTSTAAGGGVFQDVILQQAAGGGFYLVVPSATQATTASSWPAAAVDLVLNDFNLDGFVDVLVRGLGEVITGVLDQIVYAPGRSGGSSVILNAVDGSFRNFLTEVSGWAANPTTYFEQYRRTVSVPIIRPIRRCFTFGLENSGEDTFPDRLPIPDIIDGTYCFWVGEIIGYRTHVYYTNRSTSARVFSSLFSLVNGRIDPDVPLGSNAARELSRILKEIFGIEIFNGQLGQACTGSFVYDSETSVPCNNPDVIGEIMIWHTVDTNTASGGCNTPNRRLTSGEKTLALNENITIINVGQVCVHNRGLRLFHVFELSGQVVAPNGHIYVGQNSSLTWREDYATAMIKDQAALIHELVHVWQNRNKGCVMVCMIVRKILASLGDGYHYWPLMEEGDFDSYNIEQQAEMMQDRFLLENNRPVHLRVNTGATYSAINDLVPFRKLPPNQRINQ